MPKKKVLINYTNRDFDSIKDDLEEHAQRYYPDNYKDFSENTFGSFMLDAVAHVGDMLSFYLDYQVNESFLETAVEYENVRRLSRDTGYTFSGSPPAYGTAAFYVIVPASSAGLGPVVSLIPILQAGSEFKSDSGTTFVLIEDVNFADPLNEIVAARFNQATGKPASYAIRAYGQVKSTVLYRTTQEVGEFTRFRKVRIGPPSISEVKSVIDSEGHEYFQVDHLCQDVIYVNTTNPTAATDGIPQIIKPKIVPRRFVLEQDENGTYLQFGYGTDEEITTTDITDPSQVTLKMSGKTYTTDTAFDPTKLLDSNTLGVAPSNTTLTVLYYKNSTDTVKVAAGGLNEVAYTRMTFPAADGTNNLSQRTVRSSLEVSNGQPIVSDTSAPSSEEIRYRSYAMRFSQNRAVTRNDYEAMLYMMPSNFGSVKRACIINDPSSTNRRLSLYVISEDANGRLTPSPMALKQNIKTWLNKNKMLNDNIDISDAVIVNVGFNYKIVVDPTKDKVEVLNAVNQKLKSELSEKMYIGEPFYLTNIFNIINKVEGVVDTLRVDPILPEGDAYNSSSVALAEAKSEDGTYLRAPRNVIFEIKFPNRDIKGTAV